MSWIDPRTWGAAELVTAAKMNEVRDSLRSSGGARTTTLPALVDESEWCYPADTTLGAVWRLKYNSGSASAYKWEFIGGASVYSRIATSETTTSTTYVDLATVGPSITVPRAGDYEVCFGAALGHTTTANVWAAVKRGAAATSDADSVAIATSGAAAAPGFQVARTQIMTGLAASDVLLMQYRASAATATFLNRWMTVRPIRVS